MNCLFPKQSRITMEDVEAAYTKGRMELLFSLAEYNIISLYAAATLSGLSEKDFKNKLQYWRDGQEME